MNLDYVKPYANTSDLKNSTPNIHEEIAKAKEEERQFARKTINKNEDGEEDSDTLT